MQRGEGNSITLSGAGSMEMAISKERIGSPVRGVSGMERPPIVPCAARSTLRDHSDEATCRRYK